MCIRDRTIAVGEQRTVYFLAKADTAIAEKPQLEVELLVDGQSAAKQVGAMPEPNEAGLIPDVYKRQILNDAGLQEARIMASGDLDEHRIAALVSAGAPIDSFGVGTELATSADAPAMGMIYKIVELEEEGRLRYTAKNSEGKPSIPGAKQVWRCLLYTSRCV